MNRDIETGLLSLDGNAGTALSMLHHWIFAILVVLHLIVIAGCPQMAEWRDSQIKTSNQLAEGNTVVIPNPPIVIPSDLYKTLPIETSFTVLAHKHISQTGMTEVQVLVDKGLDSASKWLLVWLGTMRYRSDDNASRILEGVTYVSGGETDFAEIYVKLDFVDSERSILTLKARE